MRSKTPDDIMWNISQFLERDKPKLVGVERNFNPKSKKRSGSSPKHLSAKAKLESIPKLF